MVRSSIDIFGAATIILLILTALYIVYNVNIEDLSSYPPESRFVTHENASMVEALYLWRERLLDTLFQSFVLVATLAGVLIYVMRVREG